MTNPVQLSNATPPAVTSPSDDSCCYGCFDCGLLGKIFWIAVLALGIGALFAAFAAEVAFVVSCIAITVGAGFRWLCCSRQDNASSISSRNTSWIPFVAPPTPPGEHVQVGNDNRSGHLPGTPLPHVAHMPSYHGTPTYVPPHQPPVTPYGQHAQVGNGLGAFHAALPPTVNPSYGQHAQVGSDLGGHLSGQPNAAPRHSHSNFSSPLSSRRPSLTITPPHNHRAQVGGAVNGGNLTGTPSAPGPVLSGGMQRPGSAPERVGVGGALQGTRLSGTPLSRTPQ